MQLRRQKLQLSTFLEQNSLQQRVLVPQHKTFVGRAAVALLETLQILLMELDRSFQLLDVFGTPLTEGSLCLTVALLALLRRSIDLDMPVSVRRDVEHDGGWKMD